MLATVGLYGGLELPEQFFLLLVKAYRRLHLHAAEEVAHRAATHGFHALAAQAEHLAGLCLGRDLEGYAAVQGRHFEFAAECGHGEAHGHLAGKIGTVAAEDGMGPDANLHVEVAGGSAVGPRLALAGEPYTVARVHAGRHLHRQRLLLLHPALSVAVRAGVRDDLAPAVAARTGLLHREEALLHAHLAAAVAGGAGHGLAALLGAAAVADLAGHERWHVDVHRVAEHRLLEGEGEPEAQVRAAVDPLAAATPSAGEDVAEHVAEDVAEHVVGVEARPAAATTTGTGGVGVHARVAELVVRGALLGIGEDLVGFLGFLEVFFRGLVAGVAIRVMLHGEPAVGLLDVGLRGVF